MEYVRNVLEYLERSAARFPDQIAFADPEQEMTFGKLKLMAMKAGKILAGLIQPHEAAAFYLEKSSDALIAMFGTVYAGGFYSFIDVRQPEIRAEKVLDILKPAVIFTDQKNQEKLNRIHPKGRVLLLEDFLKQADEMNLSEEDETLRNIRLHSADQDILYVNFTSGSTGTPKGVAVSHLNVIDFISHFVPPFGIRSSDVIANQAPFDFDVSVKDIYSGLYAGARVQLIPRAYFSQPAKLMDYLCDHQATVLIWAVSAMCFVSIMNGLEYRLPERVRLVMFSGEVMPVKQLNIWGKYLPDAEYVNLYGPTEITCNCTYYVLDREFASSEFIPIGKAFENEAVFLLDEQNHLIPSSIPGKEGEICCGGTCVSLGYYRDPARTAENFLQNPLNSCYEERIYRTGDLARYDKDGNLVYAGRKDFQIKRMGHRIELGEIEADAMAADQVSRACCIFEQKSESLILFYSGKEEKKELLCKLKEDLPAFMIPNHLLQVDEMPMNKNGKIDRNELLKQYLEQKGRK